MSGLQKALLLPTKQGQFTLGDVPIPTPGSGELLVKIESTGLNPLDWKVREYGIVREDYPVLLGYDAAGIVEEVGPNVQGFAKGDNVCFQAGPTNSYCAFQQYALAAVHVTAKIPSNITFDEAVSVPSGINTAAMGLFAHDITVYGAKLSPPWKDAGIGKHAGKPILILGGSSCVGHFTIQVARLSGFSPIITTASLHNTDLLKSIGATHVLDRNLSADALHAEITKITKQPIELVWDSISEPSTQNMAYDLTSPGGTLVLVLWDTIDPAKKAAQPGKNVIAHIGADFAVWEDGTGTWQALPKLLENGSIKPMRTEVSEGGLNGIVPGLERLKNNRVSAAKLVVHPQETV
ncbi:hypothetical protein CERSUDRAFT_112362 [Gelatoporia subvermispora B]|uniref:Enoyl reductase (ER) domain-containing protein n=1 Tax=Ceriporiopsis subvermispora (strain B) TaxID=914234 RepID=M2RMR1_CERS8|nr:hypothetical protein CERSUDRAFT_112362 [Gelatoporia subvermispora B]